MRFNLGGLAFIRRRCRPVGKCRRNHLARTAAIARGRFGLRETQTYDTRRNAKRNDVYCKTEMRYRSIVVFKRFATESRDKCIYTQSLYGKKEKKNIIAKLATIGIENILKKCTSSLGILNAKNTNSTVWYMQCRQ